MTTIQRQATDEERSFFERELQSFLPDRIFDAHAHLWRNEFAHFRIGNHTGPVGYHEYMALIEDLHPGRTTKALFLSYVSADRRNQSLAANQWLAAQIAGDRQCRGHFFVRPEDDPEWVRDQVKSLGLHGLKCYHTMAPQASTWEADILDFLPEQLVRVADEEEWAITLHLVKSRAIADPANISCIQKLCRTYPRMKLILAHAARGFQPAHNLIGLPQLTGLDNLYFDTSANCEPIAHQAILRWIGHDKLLYGSDLPVSHQRGRSLGIGDSFLWLDEAMPIWQADHLATRPILVGLEHLQSLKWACWSERLSDSQVEDIFWNNAQRILGSDAM